MTIMIRIMMIVMVMIGINDDDSHTYEWSVKNEDSKTTDHINKIK